MKPTSYYDYYLSPIGNLLLLAQATGLIAIELEPEQQTTNLDKCLPASEASGEITQIFCRTQSVLDRYFQGEKMDFAELDFLTPQGTPFQHRVWQCLRQIPYGQSVSYADIAQQLGNPNAVRAVGGAVGRNPISILIPCHRVLGKNRSLTGFGGGLPRKRYLLQLENIDYRDQGGEFVNPKRKKWLA